MNVRPGKPGKGGRKDGQNEQGKDRQTEESSAFTATSTPSGFLSVIRALFLDGLCVRFCSRHWGHGCKPSRRICHLHGNMSGEETDGRAITTPRNTCQLWQEGADQVPAALQGSRWSGGPLHHQGSHSVTLGLPNISIFF